MTAIVRLIFRRVAFLVAVLAAVPVVLLPGAAHAQDAADPPAPKPDDETAAADALFREGLDLMKAGKIAEACAKFSASHRFDPSVGALLNLGNCHEKLGELATAFELFARAAEQAHAEGDDKRARYAADRMARLENRLGWLAVEVAGEARVAELEILRDGTPIAERWWNGRAPIDPGTWTIVARAPRATPFETRVEVKRAGQEVRVRIPVLEQSAPDDIPDETPDMTADTMSPEPAGKSALSLPAGRDEVLSLPAGPRDHGGMSLSRKLALGSAAAGAVALIGGGVLGWRARGLYLDAREICDNDDVESCSDDERRRSQAGRDDARSTANLATIAFAVGGAAIAAGVILWVVEPGGAEGPARVAASVSGGRPAGTVTRIVPMLGPDGAGLQVRGRF